MASPFSLYFRWVMKVIALVEIGGSHDECLLTQLHAIRNRGHQALLITSPEVAARNPAFEQYVQKTITLNVSEYSRKKLSRKVWVCLKENNVDLAVLNTAQGNVIRDLCLKSLFHKMEFVGIIHTTRMFTESFTQKVIHWKIKKYLLLSKYLCNKVPSKKGMKFDYFYPIRFVEMPVLAEKRDKSICILGGVEERRKDLQGFLDMAESVKDASIRFVFLGKSDPSKPEVPVFLDAIKKRGLSDIVQTFDHFLDQQTFASYIQNSDLILPLIHPGTPSADQYFKNQISGAMTASFGYKTPMMLHQAYEHIEEMQPASFYYEPASFSETVKKALEMSKSKSEEMRNNPAFSIEEQERRYSDFLGL